MLTALLDRVRMLRYRRACDCAWFKLRTPGIKALGWYHWADRDGLKHTSQPVRIVDRGEDYIVHCGIDWAVPGGDYTGIMYYDGLTDQYVQETTMPTKTIAMLVETQQTADYRTNSTPDNIRAYSILAGLTGARFDDVWVMLDPMSPSFFSDTYRDKVIACLNEEWLCRATPYGAEKVQAEIERFKEKLAILYGEDE